MTHTSVLAFEAAFAVACAAVAWKVNSIVSEPYMDEIFHIPQSRLYCQGRFTEYLPELTTPPGLYALTTAAARALLSLRLPVECEDVWFLRSVSLVLYLLLPRLVASIMRRVVHQDESEPAPAAKKPSIIRKFGETKATPRNQPPGYIPELKVVVSELEAQSDLDSFLTLKAYAVLSVGPAFHFAFMHYTDIGSLTCVLLSHWAALRGRYAISALLGLASLTFRQTNIIWIAFVAYSALIRHLQKAGLKDPTAASLSMSALTELITSTVTTLLRINTWKSLVPFAAFLPVPLAFAAFLRWNGGIVIGDKTNHVAVLHCPMLFYYAMFSAFFAWPSIAVLGFGRLRKLFLGPPFVRALAAAVPLLVTSLVAVHFGTMWHPFTLSDNRHYIFYLRRRILDVRWWSRYAMVPIYVAASRYWLADLASRRSLLWMVGYIGSTALVLIPTPLVEPRYFLVPYVLMRIHGGQDWRKADAKERRRVTSGLVAEIAWNMTLNALAMWAYLYKPFTWPSETGLQRFMW